MTELLAYGSSIVREAGSIMLRFYGHTTAREKGHQDLITEADLALEHFVLGKLKERYPHWQHISEEDTAKGATSIHEFCWVLDPLDGTVNFATQIPFFCISLALLHHGLPILGWVFDPLRNELFTAHRGHGSFLNADRLDVKARESLLIGTDSSLFRWMSTPEGNRFLEIMDQYGKARNLGAQALHLCYVAAGRMRAAITRGCRIWDDAAGSLIITEAGGCYSDWDGEPIFPLKVGHPGLEGSSIQSVAAEPVCFENICNALSRVKS
jgi:myo-inositol-1(or 4)-monophosphatase